MPARRLGRNVSWFAMPPPSTFFIQNFGCRAAQADGAGLAADLASRGMSEVSDRAQADLVVVNTCTVTADADQDARQAIRRVHRENPAAEILVTGCYAQRRPEDLAELPGVKWVVGNSHKPLIGDVVRPMAVPAPLIGIAGPVESPPFAYHGEVGSGGVLVGNIFEQRSFLSAPVVEAGQDRTRPNLKIQDGCNNRCAFCVIPSVRGNSRSATAANVIAQIRELALSYQEVVLTGINLGRWGRDLDGRPRLPWLLRRILAETDIAKLRLSSVEPMDWTSDLLDLIASSGRIAKHVHIPLQSGCDRTLKAMHRRYRARHYAERLRLARALMPDAAIGADVMVGFPGETDADFEESRQFIASMPFTYLHLFSYSARPGTSAAELGQQVRKRVKKERNRLLRELAAEKNLSFRRSLLGRTFDAVTLERSDNHGRAALTDNYVPVAVEGQGIEAGELVRVEISKVTSDFTLARCASSN